MSYCLREVKKGEKILVTDRDQVIVTILPVEKGKEDSKLLSLVKKGFDSWRRGKQNKISSDIHFQVMTPVDAYESSTCVVSRTGDCD